jgi:condensin complex subunit 1
MDHRCRRNEGRREVVERPSGPRSWQTQGHWDSSAQLENALATMCKVLRLKLAKIFLTTSERDTFVGLLTRPVYMILESEQRCKSTSIRMHAFKVLCIAVKHHGHGYGGLNRAMRQSAELTQRL